MKKALFSTLFIIIVSHVFAIEGLLVKTIDYSFSEKWSNNLSIPKLTISDTVYKGQYIYLTAIAGDYQLNTENKAVVQYSINITRPDNSVYFFQENLPIIDRKLENSNNLHMSDAKLKISFEANDLFGEYKIELKIFDRVSGQSKSIKSSLILAETPPVEKFIVKNQDEFTNWIGNYFKQPKPATALANYIYYSKSELSKDNSKFYTIFSVFLEIFRNNKFLLPQVLNSYEKQEEKTKLFLIYLLHFSDNGATAFLENLKGTEKEYYKQIKESKLPELYGEIIDNSQLDMLWATFLASGSYEPVLKLIKTLDYVKYSGEIEKYQNSSNKSEASRQKAINNTIYTALVWSLQSNCKQYDLVKGYAKWTLEYGDLNELQKEELNKILQGV